MVTIVMKGIGMIFGLFTTLAVIGSFLPDTEISAPTTLSEEDAVASATIHNDSDRVSENAYETASIAHNKPTEDSLNTSNVTRYAVSKVVDGDTIVVNINGTSETVRFIGIDTPETVDPRTTVQCFGREASDKTKELLTAREVTLEFDSTQGARDKYDRMLAYVYRDDGLFINKHLIENGYAFEYTYNLPYKYQSEFKDAESMAETNKRGLWAPTACAEHEAQTTNVMTSPEPSQKPPHPASNYTCSANIYNCGDFTTHEDAQAVYDACGGTSNDIHRLDADADGEACETLP